MKKYPQLFDFPRHQLQWGLTEYGIGCYTNDFQFFWPDTSCLSKAEYDKWVRDLTRRDYEIPDGYQDCYKRSFNESPKVY